MTRRQFAITLVAVVGLAGIVGCSPKAKAPPEASEVKTIKLPGGEEMDLVWVPGGSFQTGSEKGASDEQPVLLPKSPEYFHTLLNLSPAAHKSLLQDPYLAVFQCPVNGFPNGSGPYAQPRLNYGIRPGSG